MECDADSLVLWENYEKHWKGLLRGYMALGCLGTSFIRACGRSACNQLMVYLYPIHVLSDFISESLRQSTI